MDTHLLDDIVTCGPGNKAIQWKCSCGAYGKPVAVPYLYGSVSMLDRHRRHEKRMKETDRG